MQIEANKFQLLFPKDATMKEKAQMAVSFLEVIAKGVKPATKLAQTCTKVLPKILLFFGL